jgi:exodeoxyribonuclease V alpha subunit
MSGGLPCVVNADRSNAGSPDVVALKAATSNDSISSADTSHQGSSKKSGPRAGALNLDLFADIDNKRPAIADCIALLRQSHRFDSAGGIGALAVAAVRGDYRRVMQLLQHEDDEIAWQSQAGHGELIVAMATHYLPLLEAAQKPLAPERAFELMRRQGILCALRHGPYGAIQMNIAIEAVLRKRGLIGAGGEWYAGRPVMMMRNDYGLQLFNGETGIALREATGTLAVFFPAADGSLRRFTPARMVACETAFALTVHKAQGSEFENIALVLPGDASPVLGRELLYTAITRAMHKLSVWGSAEVLKDALMQRAERTSALAERVWR